MKRKLPILILSFILLALLSACTGQAYRSTGQKQSEADGREKVTEFLNANIPDAKLLSVNAVETNREVTLMTLTNYVSGEYEWDFSKYVYYYDTHNGKMYTGKDFHVLKKLVQEKVMEDLALPDTAEIIRSDIRIYLPDLEESDTYNDDVGDGKGQLPYANSLKPVSAPVLPFEVVGNVESYFNDENRREIIEVDMEIIVRPEDNIDFDTFSLEGIFNEEEEAGIYFHNLIIHNAHKVDYSRVGNENRAEVVDQEMFRKYGDYLGCNRDFAIYESYKVLETSDSVTNSILYRRRESTSYDSNGIATEEEFFD